MARDVYRNAAEDWNTYVAVHVMTDRAIRKSIEAGAKSIEHGFFASDETLKLMAKKGIWIDPQPFFEGDLEFPDPIQSAKFKQVTDATARLYPRAKKFGVKIATSQNAELLELSGPRHPYREGRLGVIAEGAYADLILVDGNPLDNPDLVADPDKNFNLIMKDGKIYKNALQ